METDLNTIKQELDEIKVEITFIKDLILDGKSNLEVSYEVIQEVKDSRKRNEKELIAHEEVFNKYCK